MDDLNFDRIPDLPEPEGDASEEYIENAEVAMAAQDAIMALEPKKARATPPDPTLVRASEQEDPAADIAAMDNLFEQEELALTEKAFETLAAHVKIAGGDPAELRAAFESTIEKTPRLRKHHKRGGAREVKGGV